ncbi:hypothetical protein CR513_35494, partial [Mucuna pruriens]
MSVHMQVLIQEKLRHEFHQNGPYFSHLEQAEDMQHESKEASTVDNHVGGDMPEQAKDVPEQAEDIQHESKEASTVDHVAGDMPPENSMEDVTMVDNSAGVANGSPTL